MAVSPNPTPGDAMYAVVGLASKTRLITKTRHFNRIFSTSKGDDTHSNKLRQYYGTTFLRHNIARLS